ncbi:MAG TPA: tyrosine--tRNA ligase [Dehalococcoidales bacterium]
MSNVFDEFESRGMIYAVTEDVRQYLAGEKVTGYIGFDPSAPSLHVGNLLTLMGLVHLQRYGHTPIAVAGGGTGLIGDPGGKSQERPLLSKEEVQTNVEGIKEQLRHFLDFETKTNPAILVNNADWLTTISLTDFLRDVGKHFTVNAMIAKESVKRRLEQEGISFTEFSYILLQSFDYLFLYEKYHCTLQMGGSDQWGNITAGVDLIRRVHGAKVHGLVFPLLTTASGTKFGKSEGNAVWLDAGLTSPYRFYQYWINTEDKDVITCLKRFTLLSVPEIKNLADSVATEPEKRNAQRTLARDVTRAVHGKTALEKAEQASRVLFGEEVRNLNLHEVLDIFADIPSVELEKSLFTGNGMALVDLVAFAGLAQSKSEARRLIQSGGVYLNNIRNADSKNTVSLANAIEGRAIILRKGPKEYRLVKISGS